MELELQINNDRRVLPSVQAFVQQTLAQVPLPTEEAGKLEQFVLHVVEDAIDRAYPAGENGLIQVAITEKQGKLEIRVRDFGLPQDVQSLEEQLHNSTNTAAALHGCDTAGLADELHWLAFGREGKSLQIIKWINSSHISASATKEELLPAIGDVPPAPEQQYTIRRMLPAEAVQVSQLMYRTYGDTYFNEDVYYPQRIAAQNAQGILISVVALGADGRVAGHEAVERNQRGSVAELGQAAIDPAHRGRGLMSRMKELLVEETRHLDLTGWFGDAVAIHTLTQQSNAHHGGHVCGVDLGISPKSETFLHIAQQQPQRVSCLIYFHWLKEPQQRCVHVPQRHREIVAAIYQNLQCPVIFGEESAKQQCHGVLRIKHVSGAASAFILTEKLGKDSAFALHHAGRELIELSRAEAVFIDLPLADPATRAVWESLEERGFGFVGIGPHFSQRGDVVRLAYLVETMAREPIKTYEPFAGRLVDYVLAEQRRVKKNL